MVIRRAGLEGLFPRGGRRGRGGRNFKSGRDLQRLIGEGLLDMKDWQTPATGWNDNFDWDVAPGQPLLPVTPSRQPPIGVRQIDPTIVRPPAPPAVAPRDLPPLTLPPGFQPIPPDRSPTPPPIGPRPPGEEPLPFEPRPPGESVMAKISQLKAQRQQLMQQIRQIEAQILSLSGRRGNMIDIGPGGEPPMPVRPPPPPLNPPTIVRPPSIGPGTPIPQPPPMPPRPPWGG